MGKFDKLYKVLKCDTEIPINDMDGWLMFPKHRWIYNKLELALYQKINCAPMPIKPKKYPIIIKPIINLYGMGLNIIKVNNDKEFNDLWFNNHFWMKFLEGDHIGWDLIILNGQIVYYKCLIGYRDDKLGKFDYWESIERDLAPIIKKIIKEHFKDFNGVVSVETINDKIIEMHLRMGDIDIYPTFDILKGIIETYKGKKFNWNNIKTNKIYFFPLWYDTFLKKNKKKIKLKKVFKILNDHIANMLRKNNFIHDFDIDCDSLAGPSDTKRLMWFTCGDKDFGFNIRNSIYDELISHF